MKKILSAATVILIMFAVCSGGSAEVIYLRDGRVLREKVVQKTDYYIITDKDGIKSKYYLGQVDRIEDDKGDIGKVNVQQFEDVGMSVNKAELIAVLINVSGVRKNMESDLAAIVNSLPEEEQDTYRELFNVDEIIEALIPLYDKYYAEKDLWAVIEFYESPAGQKTLEVTPKIMKESVEVSMEYFRKKMGMPLTSE